MPAPEVSRARLRCFRVFALLVIFNGVAAFAAKIPESSEAVAPEIVTGWQQIAQLDFRGALATFGEYLEHQPDSRAARLGLAMATLNRPPKTNLQTAAVAEELEKLRSENPNDEVGINAAYELARLYHVHFHPANLEEAARRFAAVHDAYPQHYWGQQALLRLATIELFSRWPVPDAKELVAKWEARKNQITDPVIRRNFLRKLGDAILWFDLSAERALPLFVEANEIGFSRFDYRTLMMMKVYTISVEEQMPELTRAVATRYLKEFPRDIWSQFMRDQLAKLDAEEQR